MVATNAQLAAEMKAAMAAVEAAITAVGTLSDASLAELEPVADAVSAALPTFVAATSALDSQIATNSFAGVVVGTPVPVMVEAILANLSAVQHEAIALNAQVYLARIGVNVGNAPG